MKRIVLSVYMGIMLLACDEKEAGYRITGHIDSGGNGLAVLSVWEDRQRTDLDTVTMTNGKFVFSGVLTSPVRVSIDVCPEKEKPASFSFIAENTQVRVDGKWSNVQEQYGYRSIANMEITGSRNNEVYDRFMGIYRQMLKVPENKAYAEVSQKLDILRETNANEYNRLKQETEALSEAFHQVVQKKQLELILANKSVSSVSSCLSSLASDLSLEKLKQIFISLDTDVQQGPLAKEIREELASRERVMPGIPAPDFDLETPDGTRLALSDLRGKYVILDFWASWCGPCRASFPEMKKIYARFKDRGLEILGISDDSRKEDWLKVLG